MPGGSDGQNGQRKRQHLPVSTAAPLREEHSSCREIHQVVVEFLGRSLTARETTALASAHADGADFLWRAVANDLPSPGPTRLPANARVTIGTSEDAFLRVPDRFASHLHLELRAEGRRWYAHDMNSTAGTRVDGETITGWHRVRSRSVIELGSSTAVLMLQCNPPPSTPDPVQAFLPDSILTDVNRRTLRGLAAPLRRDPDAPAASNLEIALEYNLGVETVRSDYAALLRKAGLTGRGHRQRLAKRGLSVWPLSGGR
jgi:pSer/pThr/pTyr-binding forkhead associated (FHA) protein